MGALARLDEIAAVLILYVAPSLAARTRGVRNFGSVVVINVLLGWTVIGWVVALAMAARSVPPAQARVPVQPPQEHGRHRS